MHRQRNNSGKAADTKDYSGIHESKTRLVVILTGMTMIAEIIAGYLTNSMALLADGLTSVTAIIALTAGYFYKLYSLDAISGIISSVVITRWSVGLIIHSGKELVEFNNKN